MSTVTDNVTIKFVPNTSKGTYTFNVSGVTSSNIVSSGGTIYVRQPMDSSILHSFTPTVNINYVPISKTYTYKLNFIQFPVISGGTYPTSSTTLLFSPYTTEWYTKSMRYYKSVWHDGTTSTKDVSISIDSTTGEVSGDTDWCTWTKQNKTSDTPYYTGTVTKKVTIDSSSGTLSGDTDWVKSWTKNDKTSSSTKTYYINGNDGLTVSLNSSTGVVTGTPSYSTQFCTYTLKDYGNDWIDIDTYDASVWLSNTSNSSPTENGDTGWCSTRLEDYGTDETKSEPLYKSITGTKGNLGYTYSGDTDCLSEASTSYNTTTTWSYTVSWLNSIKLYFGTSRVDYIFDSGDETGWSYTYTNSRFVPPVTDTQTFTLSVSQNSITGTCTKSGTGSSYWTVTPKSTTTSTIQGPSYWWYSKITEGGYTWTLEDAEYNVGTTFTSKATYKRTWTVHTYDWRYKSVSWYGTYTPPGKSNTYICTSFNWFKTGDTSWTATYEYSVTHHTYDYRFETFSWDSTHNYSGYSWTRGLYSDGTGGTIATADYYRTVTTISHYYTINTITWDDPHTISTTVYYELSSWSIAKDSLSGSATYAGYQIKTVNNYSFSSVTWDNPHSYDSKSWVLKTYSEASGATTATATYSYTSSGYTTYDYDFTVTYSWDNAPSGNLTYSGTGFSDYKDYINKNFQENISTIEHTSGGYYTLELTDWNYGNWGGLNSISVTSETSDTLGLNATVYGVLVKGGRNCSYNTSGYSGWFTTPYYAYGNETIDTESDYIKKTFTSNLCSVTQSVEVNSSGTENRRVDMGNTTSNITRSGSNTITKKYSPKLINSYDNSTIAELGEVYNQNQSYSYKYMDYGYKPTYRYDTYTTTYKGTAKIGSFNKSTPSSLTVINEDNIYKNTFYILFNEDDSDIKSTTAISKTGETQYGTRVHTSYGGNTDYSYDPVNIVTNLETVDSKNETSELEANTITFTDKEGNTIGNNANFYGYSFSKGLYNELGTDLATINRPSSGWLSYTSSNPPIYANYDSRVNIKFEDKDGNITTGKSDAINFSNK